MFVTYSVSDEEFVRRLIAAKEARSFTVNELAQMCKTSPLIMEKWLGGHAPQKTSRESVLRAVE